MNPNDEQAGSEADFLDGPGFTAADVKPTGAFTGLNPMTPVRGIFSGALEAGSVLVHGLPGLAHALSQGDQGDMSPTLEQQDQQNSDPNAKPPWQQPLTEWSDNLATQARAGAKSVIPDPRTTGSAANLVFGASKTLTEAGVALAGTAGNIPAAAAGMGYISGMARYQDLKDEGVDEATAEKLATTEGLLQGVGMVAPVGLPVKFIEGMTPIRQALTQLATGAAANAGQGMASRYITHKILDDAGYPELAAQSKVLDGQAIAADLISGGFFGGAHYMGQRPELAARATQLAENGTLDTSVRDAARVVQTERQAAVERAPGVPVNAESQAVHQASLEKAINDLLQDKPVDVEDEADHGIFARAAEDYEGQLPLKDMMLDEFKKAGVADEAAKLDGLEGLYERQTSNPVKPQEKPIELPVDEEEPQATGWEHEEQEIPERPEVVPVESPTPGAEPAEAALARAKDNAALISDQAPKAFSAAAQCAGSTI